MRTVNKTIELNGVKTKIQYQIDVNEIMEVNELTIIVNGHTYNGFIEVFENKAKTTTSFTQIFVIGNIRAKNEKTLLELLLNKK